MDMLIWGLLIFFFKMNLCIQFHYLNVFDYVSVCFENMSVRECVTMDR